MVPPVPTSWGGWWRCTSAHPGTPPRAKRAPAERSEAFQYLQLGTRHAKNYTQHKNSPGQRPNGVIDPVCLFGPVCYPPLSPPGTTGILFRAGPVPLGSGRGSPEILGPPFGPKMKLINFLGPPLGASFAAEHAPRTLSGPPKNRSERKMKMLKSAQEIHQNLSPGELLPIEDPPKRGSMDLIKFPEGPR